jgi:hypothetical protein
MPVRASLCLGAGVGVRCRARGGRAVGRRPAGWACRFRGGGLVDGCWRTWARLIDYLFLWCCCYCGGGIGEVGFGFGLGWLVLVE